MRFSMNRMVHNAQAAREPREPGSKDHGKYQREQEDKLKGIQFHRDTLDKKENGTKSGRRNVILSGRYWKSLFLSKPITWISRRRVAFLFLDAF